MSFVTISGSGLKMIAMVAMVVDHTASRVLYDEAAFMEPLLTIGGRTVSWVFLMRCIGRLAFPLFAFLLVEGFLHTGSRLRYGLSLLAFALLSEVPYDLLRHGVLVAPGQNVFFTLFFGFLALTAVGRWEERRLDSLRLAFVLFALMVTVRLAHCDYGASGLIFIVVLYVLRRQYVLQAAIGAVMLPLGLAAALAFIPISFYNGQRGFIQGPVSKYLFYAFYPCHLLALYLIKSW